MNSNLVVDMQTTYLFTFLFALTDHGHTFQCNLYL